MWPVYTLLACNITLTYVLGGTKCKFEPSHTDVGGGAVFYTG